MEVWGHPVDEFQSSPDREAGCNLAGSVLMVSAFAGFQSSPDREAGCNALPYGLYMCSVPNLGFNPHPTVKPGATQRERSCSLELLESNEFQSSPDREAGCNRTGDCPPPPSPSIRSFNPHPTVKPGATSRHSDDQSVRRQVEVSILTRP